MTNAGLPVPPGFTISTDACRAVHRDQRQGAAGGRPGDARAPEDAREDGQAQRSDRTTNPLLVSVRSGAKFSMPGMMDTILNLGLNDVTVEALKAKTGERPLRVRQLPPLHPDVRQRRARDPEGRSSSTSSRPSRRRRASRKIRSSTRRRCARSSARYKTVVKAQAKRDFPQDPVEQLRLSRDAVFRSWQNPRAKEYRRIYDIPDRDRHRRQRAGDGVRQHRRSLGHRRRLHAQSRHGRQGVLRRVPHQRAGRGRGRRHPHAAADRRPRDA